ncbi:MAG: phosphotransferase [Chloroflexota bacterium]|nr:phosphotransferase [Chloroflexota bacterium]
MIPLPPCDPNLPGLATVFDEASMVCLLASHLDAGDGFAVVGCRPRYIRYKPGTSCLVQFDLTFRDVWGGEMTVVAHLKLFVDDRARRRVTSTRIMRLQERAQAACPDLPERRVAFIAELNGLLQLYPVDYDLRFLTRAADPAWMSGKIGLALADRSIAVCGQPELIRYKPERKALFRYDLSHGPHERIYGKLYEDGRGERLATHTAALIAAGVATPPVVISLPDRQFVAHAEAVGIPLAALRGAAGYDDWMEPLATSLHRLQGVELPDLTAHRLADEIAAIVETSELLGMIAPRLASRFGRVAREIARRLSAVDDVLQTAHGDFYDDQAIVSGDGLTLIDLDELRLSHPAIDAGNMLAHLTSGGARGDDVLMARDAFQEAVLSLRPELEGDLPTFEAAALVKLAPGPFRRLESDWPEGIERILALAEGRLHLGGQPVSAPESSGAMHDPMLPQLAQVRDSATMARRLSGVFGEAAVTGAHLIRHKPGRRAIVGYDLDSGGQLYGKTFASGRGPRVYRITQLICSARAFGPDVALPEPVAYLADLKLLIQREVGGEPVDRALRGGDLDLAARIAVALHRLHVSGLDLGRTHDLAKELSPLGMRTEAVVAQCPDLQELAWSCHTRIHGLAARPFPWRLRPIHRDFYHDQVLIDGDDLAVLDLDDATMSEPAVDVANFAAHLRLLGYQHPGSAAALTRVEDAFVRTYRALDPDLDPALLRFLTATTLLRLSGIHVSRADGDHIAQQSLEAAADALDGLVPLLAVHAPEQAAISR